VILTINSDFFPLNSIGLGSGDVFPVRYARDFNVLFKIYSVLKGLKRQNHKEFTVVLVLY
jgi:hypothetical protein